jgi:voltage-gated potassium channel Kch
LCGGVGTNAGIKGPGLLHDLFEWIQNVPGAVDDDPFTSWSAQFGGSLHLWALTEGTHIVSLMLFAGTIMIVDLRMLGLLFRDVPVSALNDRVLPLTVAGFALVIVTGVLLFLANPLQYYHSVWFRGKVIFLLLAAANIAWFHLRVQKSQGEWDAGPSPPAKVKIAAVVSLASWMLVILFGRFTALSVFECENLTEGSFLYGFAECAAEFEAYEDEFIEDAATEEAFTEDTPTEDTGTGE